MQKTFPLIRNKKEFEVKNVVEENGSDRSLRQSKIRVFKAQVMRKESRKTCK